jgi:hypothetical protein
VVRAAASRPGPFARDLTYSYPAVKRLLLPAAVLVSMLLVYLALRPICVPLVTEDLAQFTVPIGQRTDRDFYVRVFQLRGGRWHQCKTWFSRQMFF